MKEKDVETAKGSCIFILNRKVSRRAEEKTALAFVMLSSHTLYTQLIHFNTCPALSVI